MTRHGLMTEIVYEYFTANPGASLEEAAKALDLPSRANVRYHILKLAEQGKMELPNGKHRMFRVKEG